MTSSIHSLHPEPFEPGANQSVIGSGSPGIPWDTSDWEILGVLLVAALFAFIFCLGSFGILDPSDGYYSEGAREMFESGNWLVPNLNYAWFFDKPIMNYWLIAASYRLFGVSEFASRLPAATCGALLVPGMYAFCRQFLRRRAALLGALALLSSPMWLILGHMSLTDMPLSFFIWVALGSFFVALERRRNRLVWLGYVAVGFGLLTKGPLALFLVAMNLGVYILIRRPSLEELWELILRLQVIPGLLLSFAIAAPWYLLVNADTRGAFFQEFFLNQNINRAMGTVDHKAGPLYYIPVLIGAAFPWTIVSLLAARLWFKPSMSYLKQRLGKPSANLPLNFRCTTFGVLIAFVTATFFSVLPTKLVTYLLPVVPALALVGGYTFDKLLRFKAAKMLVSALASITAIIGGAGAALLIYSLVGGNFQFLRGKSALVLRDLVSGDVMPRDALCAAFVIMFVGSVVSFRYAKLGRLRFSAAAFVACIVMSVPIAVPMSIVLSYQQKSRDMQDLVRYSRENNISPLMLGRRTPSATFYLGSKVTYLAGPSELSSYLSAEKETSHRSYFLVHQVVFDDLKLPDRGKCLIKQSGDWILGRNY
jgi:4-amino-4-deoxy-L-arabinose transferase-like glycosyltransferase